MAKSDLTLAAIGCSGPVSDIFVHGFLDRGIKLRILARDPASVAARFPAAEVVRGSLMNPSDVAAVTEGVDAAFVLTPMGMRNDPTLEIEAGRSIIAGARSGGLKHFIYTSVLGPDRLRGVGILDSKYHIERMLADSGLPRTILRCGSYMEDVFDPRLALLNKGKFLFPVTRERRFSYTSQRDVPRFVAEALLAKGEVLNRAFNFVSPGTLSVREVETLLSEASGFPIKAVNRFPAFYLFHALLPYFRLKNHRFSSIVPLIAWFDKHGYTDPGPSVADVRPEFRMTTLQEHLRTLWPR